MTRLNTEWLARALRLVRLIKGGNRIVLRITEAPMEAFLDVPGITLIPVGWPWESSNIEAN